MLNATSRSRSAWDIGLSQNIAGVVQARSTQYGDDDWNHRLPALRSFHHFINRSTSRREASPTVQSILATVLSPILQEAYPEENTSDVIEELLAVLGTRLHLLRPFLLRARECCLDHTVLLTAAALGQDRADIIIMMGEEGIFHVLTKMLMYTPTSDVTAGCLAKLAGTCGPAGREAQVGVTLTCQGTVLKAIVHALALRCYCSHTVHVQLLSFKLPGGAADNQLH